MKHSKVRELEREREVPKKDKIKNHDFNQTLQVRSSFCAVI